MYLLDVCQVLYVQSNLPYVILQGRKEISSHKTGRR